MGVFPPKKILFWHFSINYQNFEKILDWVKIKLFLDYCLCLIVMILSTRNQYFNEVDSLTHYNRQIYNRLKFHQYPHNEKSRENTTPFFPASHGVVKSI